MREGWDFANYMEEIICLSEILEVPGTDKVRDRMIEEMWDRFPEECKAVGLKDRE